MQLANGLVMLSIILTSFVIQIESATNSANKRNKKNQLIIYDPQSGKELEASQYLPILTGNKRKPSKPNGNLIELPQLWSPCTCFNFLCMCCLGLRLGESFNNRICIIIEYNPTQFSIELRIRYNRRTVAQIGFSARNPPAYCVPILIPLPVFACLRLYDIRPVNGNVQVCLALMMNVFANTVFEFNFECIRFGANGVRFLKHGQLEMESSLENEAEDDDDEVILKVGEERRQNIELEENYSGISVESEDPNWRYQHQYQQQKRRENERERDRGVTLVRKGKRGRK